ncbi:MAG: hypothetical protein ACHQ0Y_05985 [Thermodesulfovibrionales bacterium]
MRDIQRRACAMVFFLIFLHPLSSWGAEKNNYLLLKGGTYTFMDSLKDANLATGFDGELAYGRYILPNLVLEGATGYFHDGVNKGYGNDVKGIPVTLTAKGVYPIKDFEPFVGAGIGVYFTKFHGKVKGTVNDVSRTIPGGHVVIGSYYNFTQSLFAGVEGKYIFTEKADFGTLRTSLNGFTATATFGYRF